MLQLMVIDLKCEDIQNSYPMYSYHFLHTSVSERNAQYYTLIIKQLLMKSLPKWTPSPHTLITIILTFSKQYIQESFIY